ncbi:hypothetical protein WLH_05994 [Escherichia coli O25b:H4]|uniref:Uncharacterized protein n=1 Tax=Escherichia coli O25b:H4 TaxID=941280 RepID=A0A192CN08_ECO25|nr:hypothetical protein WLH_05994 [Escherichia coli O25b:H4]
MTMLFGKEFGDECGETGKQPAGTAASVKTDSGQ